ncbi:coil containing protein [Vibrio phage 1.244.A._10N.261.54.C3]|nr:coil containing protein [Vibrio phage 1.244.A._10N.261.54.C3]AUR98639.1 coil containing protein [Vibrio phage 1.255.O._10N.286.45.F1]
MPTLKSLLEGVDGLTQDTVERAEAILEARAQEIAQEKIDESATEHANEITSLNESHATALAESAEEGRERLVEGLDQFLEATVKEWAIDNAVAIDGELKVQLAESMLQGVAGLMVEHNIEVPEGAENLVEQLENQVVELTEESDRTLAENVRLTAELTAKDKLTVESAVLEGLASTQKERVMQLAEGTEYRGVESYTARLETFRDIVVEGKDKDKGDKDKGDMPDSDDKGDDKGDKDKGDKKPIKESVISESVGGNAAAAYLASQK